MHTYNWNTNSEARYKHVEGLLFCRQWWESYTGRLNLPATHIDTNLTTLERVCVQASEPGDNYHERLELMLI